MIAEGEGYEELSQQYSDRAKKYQWFLVDWLTLEDFYYLHWAMLLLNIYISYLSDIIQGLLPSLPGFAISPQLE